MDDDSKIAALISKSLKAEAYVVDVLHNGAEALAPILSAGFDAVVSVQPADPLGLPSPTLSL